MQTEQSYLANLRVTHTLDHIKIVLIDKFGFGFGVFAFRANVDATFLTPEKWKWVLWYVLYLNLTVFIFNGVFVIFCFGFFIFYFFGWDSAFS